jgi:hypothetical protein
LSEQIWAVGRGALVAAAVGGASAFLGAGLVYWLASGTGLEVSYGAWLALLFIGVALTALCTFLSKLIANRHAEPAEVPLWTSTAIETVALGFSVLTPLAVQTFAIALRSDPYDLLDSALGNIFLLHLGSSAHGGYILTLALTTGLALAVCVGIAGAVIGASEPGRRERATNFAFVIAIVLLALNTLLLQPWLPSQATIAPDSPTAALRDSLVPLVAVVLVTGSLLFVTRGFMRSAIDATLAAARTTKDTLKFILVFFGGLLLGLSLVALLAFVAALLIAFLGLGGLVLLSIARFIAGSFDLILTAFTGVAGILLLAWLLWSVLAPALRWLDAALPKNVAWRIAGVLASIFIVFGAIHIPRFFPPESSRDDQAASQTEGNVQGQAEESPRTMFSRATVLCATSSPEWMLSDQVRLDMPVERCRLLGLENARAVIVVGSASAAGPNSTEEQRALERGWRLAGRVSTDPSVQVFVLNLGKVDAPEARSIPIIAPYFVTRDLPRHEVPEAFASYLRANPLPAHSMCRLYRYDGSTRLPALAASESDFRC